MRWRSWILVLAMILPFAAGAEDKPERKRRVRASEPTVVTVEGRADAVDADRSKGLPSRIGSGIRAGVTGTARAIVGFGGWLLNTGDDIPSERERRGRSKDSTEPR